MLRFNKFPPSLLGDVELNDDAKAYMIGLEDTLKVESLWDAYEHFGEATALMVLGNIAPDYLDARAHLGMLRMDMVPTSVAGELMEPVIKEVETLTDKELAGFFKGGSDTALVLAGLNSIAKRKAGEVHV